MRIIKYFLICFLSIGFTVNAQTKKAENTLLWEISGKDLKKSSYLFGTYHFADKGFIDTMKVLNEKLNQAEAVVGELVMDKDMAMKLLPYMTMKDNTLDSLLTPKEFKLVADYLKTLGKYDLTKMNKLKPIMIQTIILQASAPRTFTATNPAIDQYIQDYGKANQKKIFGLETVEDQAKVLFGNSLVRQKEMLVKSVKEAKKIKKGTLKLYHSYITQNLKELEKMFANPKGFTTEEMNELLKNRNDKWIVQLPQMMQNQSLFIAVGAGHLVGADGLIKGLLKLGYTVKPVATN
ncbi:hypothetical protein GM921_13760 [Pedobacter sp. LMG 31464]|uniref:TraB/GumN family protein n=1 Tax=Pedobacter planticolens TaxID=2679964 RepID=A0A923IW55_9SPHI|nr:TraB/GumN family protein [Pedobacter planticolens]MBB2146563.1 hypothetical protein [Pedobacter planticolens]